MGKQISIAYLACGNAATRQDVVFFSPLTFFLRSTGLSFPPFFLIKDIFCPYCFLCRLDKVRTAACFEHVKLKPEKWLP